MIGRGIQGAPWRLAEIAHALGWGPAPAIPEGRAFLQMVQEHYGATLAFYGETLGARVIRKHLGWYMDRAGTPAGVRREVLSAGDPARVRALLPAALEHRAEAA
jgi:tRNA-dihydrouridine synthase